MYHHSQELVSTASWYERNSQNSCCQRNRATGKFTRVHSSLQLSALLCLVSTLGSRASYVVGININSQEDFLKEMSCLFSLKTPPSPTKKKKKKIPNSNPQRCFLLLTSPNLSKPLSENFFVLDSWKCSIYFN